MSHYYKLATPALELIIAESSREYPNETGGILIGKFNENENYVLIEYATASGPGAQFSPSHFRRDGDYSQMLLDEIVTKSDGEYDYIGEWHSHPVKSGPSARDRAAMRWIAKNSKYAIKQPIMGLCTNEAPDTWRLSFFLFDGRRLRELKSFPCLSTLS